MLPWPRKINTGTKEDRKRYIVPAATHLSQHASSIYFNTPFVPGQAQRHSAQLITCKYGLLPIISKAMNVYGYLKMPAGVIQLPQAGCRKHLQIGFLCYLLQTVCHITVRFTATTHTLMQHFQWERLFSSHSNHSMVYVRDVDVHPVAAFLLRNS